MIRITYVTITYNAAKVLQRTLDSVLEQDYHDIVHLIIDGASTDDTLKIVDDYIARSNAAENGHRIQVMSEPDKGIYDAMNKGLRSLDGDYVCFLNAGDFLPAPNIVSSIVETLTSSLSPHSSQLPAVLYGDTDIVDGEGRFLHLRRHRPPKLLTWRSFKKGMLVCHQAFYARLDIARQFPYDLKYRHSADVDWCIRVMKEAEHRGLPLVNANVIVANFEEGGDTTQHHQDSLWERFYVMATHYGYIQTVLLHAWFVLRSVLMKLNCYL